MGIVPKGVPQPGLKDNVRAIRSGGHAGGRKASTTYDPATGREIAAKGSERPAKAKGYLPPTRDSSAEFDVFRLVEEKGYSEERFYCRSVNADGHGEKLSLRVPQGIDSQMHAAVAEVPEYKTMHDLIRDSVIHRLEFLQKRYNLGDGARRMLELERLRAGMARRAQETEIMQGAVDELEEKLTKLWDMEDWAMMAEELEEGGEIYEWLREPYKSRSKGVLEKWKLKAREKLQMVMDEKERGE